jgi:3-oxoacyl-[acyl-carrier protein] reductase
VNLELQGKIALVTGSSRGIGQAIARKLAGEGARVILNGRSTAELEVVAADCDAAGFMVGDVSNAETCRTMAERITGDYGRLDILVCNVGSGASVPPGSETPEEWQRMLDINLLGATYMVGAATTLLAQSRGVVLCISSICGIEALGCPVAYSAAKAALNAYVRSIARPLGGKGVRINALAPGNIIFPGSVWERKLNETPSQVEAMLARGVALGRLGTAEEVADFAVFLASPRSAFATGAVFVVDGGQLRS